jgi:hypothetical protein
MTPSGPASAVNANRPGSSPSRSVCRVEEGLGKGQKPKTQKRFLIPFTEYVSVELDGKAVLFDSRVWPTHPLNPKNHAAPSDIDSPPKL